MGVPARVPAPLRSPVALQASYKDSVMRVLGFGALGLWGFRGWWAFRFGGALRRTGLGIKIWIHGLGLGTSDI